MMIRAMALVALVALTGCGSNSQTPAPAQTPSSLASAAPSSSSSPIAPAPALMPSPETSQDLTVLDSRDCRTVAQAYAEAVARNDFAFAARVWNDPVTDAARLRALFTGYAVPQVEITKVQEEGAAGSLYCTVTGTLTDVADANKPSQQGEIVLRRVNDVPGATAGQLRWTIRSSTFVEKLEHSSKGGPT
jgi:hypothetical protein